MRKLASVALALFLMTRPTTITTPSFMTLYRIPVAGNASVQRLPFVERGAYMPAVAHHLDRLVYTRGSGDFDLWQADGHTVGRHPVSSSEADFDPQFRLMASALRSHRPVRVHRRSGLQSAMVRNRCSSHIWATIPGRRTGLQTDAGSSLMQAGAGDLRSGWSRARAASHTGLIPDPGALLCQVFRVTENGSISAILARAARKGFVYRSTVGRRHN
jgi:hypothetical protein